MADITVTAASVVPGSDAVIDRGGTAGATITAGQVVYKEAASGTYKLADANSATAEVRQPDGIALNGASANQPIAVQTGGSITIGATVVAGTTYVLSSATAGGIAPQADLTTGDDVVILGVATSTSAIKVSIVVSGVTL